MQPHGRLAGSGPTLHGEQPVERGADDLVLFGLDGGNDVEHLAGTRPFELGQQRVAAAQSGSREVRVDAGEEVVRHRDDPPTVDHYLAAAFQPEGVVGPGPVEGHGDRCTPVDDDGVTASILHVTAADVPRPVVVLLVDAPEEQRARALGQNGHPADQRGLVVEVGVSGAAHILEQDLGPCPHVRQRIVGPIEIVLFGEELGIPVRIRSGHHGGRTAFNPLQSQK